MNLIEQIKRIERVDQMIRMRATGPPEKLAEQLGISRRTLFNILDFMKNQGAEIGYSQEKKSYYYKTKVYFHFGFSKNKLDLNGIKGGMQNFFDGFFDSAKFLH